MLAGYAKGDGQHTFLICVADNPLHPDPVVFPIFGLVSMPVGDRAQRYSLARLIIVWTNDAVEGGLPISILDKPEWLIPGPTIDISRIMELSKSIKDLDPGGLLVPFAPVGSPRPGKCRSGVLSPRPSTLTCGCFCQS